MNKVNLDNLRQTIGALDQELLSIFAKRRQLSVQVAENKYSSDKAIRDQAQEKNLLTNLVLKGEELGIDASSTLSLFHNIIEDSVRTQYDYFLSKNSETSNQVVQVALLGEPESYSHIAARNHYSTKLNKLEAIHCKSFLEIFSKVASQEVAIGFVPIENTTSGNITEIHDLLVEFDLKIIGEEKLKVKHCLVATEASSMESLKDVYSHPQAIAQCKDFFNKHPKIQSHYRSSSSSAIKLVEEYQNPAIGAIASELAAEKSGLKVLQYGINNYQENYTRFLLISKKTIQVADKIPAKTSIIIQTTQKVGSLVDCLQILKNNRINMTKLESRPIANKPWQEMFYIDFEGNLTDMQVDKALHELKAQTSKLIILGCYPQHDILATKLDTHVLSNADS